MRRCATILVAALCAVSRVDSRIEMRAAQSGAFPAIVATLDADGVRASPADGRWRLNLSTLSIRCGEREIGVARANPVVASGPPRRVSVTRNVHVDEWLEAGARGFEHGYTLQHRPCESSGSVTLELETRGLMVGRAGHGASFVDHSGLARLSYGELAARDARGAVVPSRMTVSGSRILIDVDVTDAIFPVAVDPLLSLDETLTASDGASKDWFGGAVAVFGDTVLVGAKQHTVGTNTGQGAVYAFVGSSTTYTEKQMLFDQAGASNDWFGSAVAMSADTAIIGGGGSAYAFVRSNGIWNQQKVFARGRLDDDYGRSVAIDGDTAIVGATAEGINGNPNVGAAHVYVRSGVAWSEQQVLSASNGVGGDAFGISVSVSGDTAVVGAYSKYFRMAALHGSAYVFTRSGAVWTMQQELVIDNTGDTEVGEFGYAVAISGDTILVGAPWTTRNTVDNEQGTAYVFTKQNGFWSLAQTIVADDGSRSELFGYSVSLSGDMALIGALLHRPLGHLGTAYLFGRTGTVWGLKDEIVGEGPQGDNQVASALSLSSDTVVIGAPKMAVGSSPEQGVAFVGSASTCSNPGCRVLSDAGAFPAAGGAGNTTGAAGIGQSPGNGTSADGAAGCGCRTASNRGSRQSHVAGLALLIVMVRACRCAFREGRRRFPQMRQARDQSDRWNPNRAPVRSRAAHPKRYGR